MAELYLISFTDFNPDVEVKQQLALPFVLCASMGGLINFGFIVH